MWRIPSAPPGFFPLGKSLHGSEVMGAYFVSNVQFCELYYKAPRGAAGRHRPLYVGVFLTTFHKCQNQFWMFLPIGASISRNAGQPVSPPAPTSSSIQPLNHLASGSPCDSQAGQTKRGNQQYSTVSSLQLERRPIAASQRGRI